MVLNLCLSLDGQLAQQYVQQELISDDMHAWLAYTQSN
jgi:hypothetical protein